MCAAVTNLAAAGFHDPAEARGLVPGVVRTPPQWPQPQIPIQPLGRCAIRDGLVIHLARIVPARDLLHFAHDPISDSPAGLPGPFGGARLGTHLHGDLIGPRCLYHGLPLTDRDRRGLLYKHVLAALARVYSLHSVPMIRRGDHHAVDILSLEHITVIAIRRRLLPSVVP